MSDYEVPADYYEYGPELQRAKDWSTNAGLHMAVIMSALATTEACLAIAGESLDSEFETTNRLRIDLARALPIVEAAGALVEHWTGDCEDGDPAGPWERQTGVLLDALARAVDAGKGTG